MKNYKNENMYYICIYVLYMYVLYMYICILYVYYMYIICILYKYIISNHKMVLKCVCNDSEMLFNDFEMFCL